MVRTFGMEVYPHNFLHHIIDSERIQVRVVRVELGRTGPEQVPNGISAYIVTKISHPFKYRASAVS